MSTRLLWLSLGGLLTACGAPVVPAPQPKAAETGVAPVVSSVPVVKAPFAPLGPPRDMAPADKAKGPTCTVTEHVLGALADPGESLFPVAVVADAQGGLAAWLAPTGLALQPLHTGGDASGAATRIPGTWQYVPVLLLSPGEAILLVMGPAEITVSRFERSSLRPLGERRFPRPRELGALLEMAMVGADLWLVGAREQALLFFSVGRKGPSHTSVVSLPRALPADPLVTMGRKDGSMAVLISTIAGEAWIVAETGVQEAEPADLAPSLGRFVRTLPSDFRTGATVSGLQTIPRYPLSRADDARLQEEKPPPAFVTRGTYGLPSEAWTGTHFLFGEAQGTSEDGKRDKLSAVLAAVDCRGR